MLARESAEDFSLKFSDGIFVTMTLIDSHAGSSETVQGNSSRVIYMHRMHSIQYYEVKIGHEVS